MTPRALVLLGYYFWRTLLLRWLRPRNGLAAFHESYAADKLPPVTAAERHALKAFSSCIACGMCDASFAAWPSVDRAAFHGPMDLPLSYSRGMPDYDTLGRYLAQLDRGDLVRIERLCPARIPFRDLAAFARKKAAEIEELGVAAGAIAARASGDGDGDGEGAAPRLPAPRTSPG
ncbi:MAG: hypothetical protein IT379_07375 [Deltaproteobacteria bacterium]|nr:hypothetical protein [Deltaproteobacteria bacterium]